MNKIYLKIFIGIIVSLWVIYFFQMWNTRCSNSSCSSCSNSSCSSSCSNCSCSNCSCSKNKNKSKSEGFTPKINGAIRPYTRNISRSYESFVGDYSPSVIAHKFKRWNIL